MNLLKSRLVKDLLIITLLFIVSRFAIYTICFFGHNLFPMYETPPSYTVDQYGIQRMDIPISLKETHTISLRDFVKFDSIHYYNIASRGYDTYQMSEQHPNANWPFFPLYPILMKLFSFIIPIDSSLALSISGYFLSNMFAILGLYFVLKITREITGDETISQKTIIYLLLFPTSIYLSLIYTESLFIFLTALSIYLALKKKFAWSILIAGLSMVTKVQGVANVLFILYFIFKEAGFNPIRVKLKHYIFMVLSAIPLMAYFTYMYLLTGDFFAVPHESDLNWGRTFSPPWAVIVNYLKDPTFISFHGWDLSIAGFIFTLVAFIVFAIYLVIYKKHFEYLIYGLALILIPLSSCPIVFTSVIRYYIICIPMFIVMATLGSKYRVLDLSLTVLLFGFNVIYSIGYINGYYFVV